MRKITLLLSLFSLTIMLHAQSLLVDFEAPVIKQELDEVVIYHQPLTSIGLLSFPVISVTRDELERFSFATPADALQQQAGISLTRDGIWATSVNIRGLSRERVLMLVDGNRLLTATDISGGLSTVDLNSLSHIEVIRGAASVIYGTGAMGGVVNFVTERPRYNGGYSLRTNGRAGTGFNSVNNLWTNHAQLQVSRLNRFLSVSGSYRTAQNTMTPVGVLENSQFEDFSLGIQGGMLLSNSRELLVNYQRFEARNVGISGGPFPDIARVRYRNMSRNLLSADYVLHHRNIYLPRRTLVLNELRFNIYSQNVSREVENIIAPQNLTILPSSFNATHGARITANWHLSSPHRFTTGIEGWQRRSEGYRLRVREIAENRYSVRYEKPLPDATMLNLGTFLQHSWENRSQNFGINSGFRFDFIRVNNDSAYDPVALSIIENGNEIFQEDVEQNLLFAANVRNEFSYSAHIDFVYRLNTQHQLSLSLSNAYRAASLEERFRFIDLGTRLELGNPNLRPEQGIFTNLSHRFHNERFTLQTNVFVNYLFNLITATLQQIEMPDSEAVTALVNTNIDEAFFLGGEIELFYRISNRFWTTANAGYTRARDVRKNEFLPQIPPLHGMAALNYRIPNALTASVSANFAARQRQAAKNEEQTAGYIVLNANIRSERIFVNSAYLQLFAGVDNILNTTYFNHLRTTRFGFAQAEAGRNFFVRVQVGW